MGTYKILHRVANLPYVAAVISAERKRGGGFFDSLADYKNFTLSHLGPTSIFHIHRFYQVLKRI